MGKALEEVNGQLKKAKWKIGCNIFNLIAGIFLCFTIFLAIIGVPLIIFSIIGWVVSNNKLDKLKIKKAELEDKK